MEQTTPGATVAPASDRDVKKSILRGLGQHCPACGKGEIYGRYLKVHESCPACGEELHHHRADDAPPYFTMLITGHVVVGALMTVETTYAPPMWVHAAIWGPMIILMSLFLLPRIKGALIGLQWALRMHGFSGKPDEVEVAPAARAPQA
ncbi:MAG: DUF983 domain-containing protein [Hyphomicrobiaceae bacterium]|nr:DUF983 domain-containing protein [Hyphomicrobiaceae bacterium]